MKISNIVRASALVGIVLAAPSLASASPPCERACTCDFVDSAPDLFYQDGQVPTNARLFIPAGPTTTIQLAKASAPQTFLPVMVVEQVANGSAVWVKPMADLDPSSDYILTVPSLMRQIDFTTASGPLTQTPATPQPTVNPIPDGKECDPVLGFEIGVPALTDGTLAEIVLSAPGQPDQTRFVNGRFVGPIIFGKSDGGTNCPGTPTLPNAAKGQTFTATITVFDAAGNPSATAALPSAAVASSKPGDPSQMVGACGGCAVATAGGPASLPGIGVGLGLGLVALVLRSRRALPQPRSLKR